MIFGISWKFICYGLIGLFLFLWLLAMILQQIVKPENGNLSKFVDFMSAMGSGLIPLSFAAGIIIYVARMIF